MEKERERGDEEAATKVDATKIAKWHVIYPSYLNTNCTTAEGRRVVKKLAVADPSPKEIVEALTDLKFNVAFESGKAYSRNPMLYGRIRYNPSADAGKLTKGQLMREIAKLIAEKRATAKPVSKKKRK